MIVGPLKTTETIILSSTVPIATYCIIMVVILAGLIGSLIKMRNNTAVSKDTIERAQRMTKYLYLELGSIVLFIPPNFVLYIALQLINVTAPVAQTIPNQNTWVWIYFATTVVCLLSCFLASYVLITAFVVRPKPIQPNFVSMTRVNTA